MREVASAPLAQLAGAPILPVGAPFPSAQPRLVRSSVKRDGAGGGGAGLKSDVALVEEDPGVRGRLIREGMIRSRAVSPGAAVGREELS